MKKLFLAMVAVAAFAFVGCDKEKTPSVKNIVGTWELYKQYEEYEGEKEWNTEFGESEGRRVLVAFHEDGTYTDTELMLKGSNWSAYTTSGNYIIDGKNLLMTYQYSSSTINSQIEKLTANELVVLTYDDDAMLRNYFKRVN